MGQYEMDTLDTSSINWDMYDSVDLDEVRVDPETVAIYDTTNVENEAVANYINEMGTIYNSKNVIEGIQKSTINDAIGHYNSSEDVQSSKQALNTAKENAADIYNNIDINSLSNSDYKQMMDATLNANSKNNSETLDSYVERAATIRHMTANMSDKQMANLLQMTMRPEAQNEMIEQAKELYPECMPSEEQLTAYKEQITEKLLDEKPRPDVNTTTNIRNSITNASDKVYEQYRAKTDESMQENKNAENAAKKAKATSKFNTYGLDAPLPTSTVDNNFGFKN